jgi:glyoxylase-like metal-dependent hydrolase (beta-lactamase superfamily II)
VRVSLCEINGYAIDPVVDGIGRLRPAETFPAVAADRWERHRPLLDRGGLLPITVGGFLVRGHDRIILIDLGYGPGSLGDTPTGRLLDSLRALAVEPADVTDVLFTHLHRDHIGWASVDAVPQFPNATFRCDPADYGYFVEQGKEPAVAERLGPCARQFEAFDDSELPPGITTVHAPGHTPGSTIVVLSAGTARLLMLGDVVHCPVQLLEPDWTTPWDVDPALARRTRKRLISEVAGESSVELAGAHFPGMRFGRLLGTGRHRRWLAGEPP